MTYNLIGLDSQKHILGNFIYINEHLEETPFENKFNIIILESIEDLPEIEDLENNRIITLFPNKKYYFCNTIKEIFDRFELPYCFINKEKIEQYY